MSGQNSNLFPRYQQSSAMFKSSPIYRGAKRHSKIPGAIPSSGSSPTGSAGSGSAYDQITNSSSTQHSSSNANNSSPIGSDSPHPQLHHQPPSLPHLMGMRPSPKTYPKPHLQHANTTSLAALSHRHHVDSNKHLSVMHAQHQNQNANPNVNVSTNHSQLAGKHLQLDRSDSNTQIITRASSYSEPLQIQKTQQQTATPGPRSKVHLFQQVQHDVNNYTQKFLHHASKLYWYVNEYSATRDMISCTPMTMQQFKEVHQKAYSDAVLDDKTRKTAKSNIFMIDSRIGASYDKVYNAIYGVYQQFVDKNNHISFIYNDRVIHDKLAQINIINVVMNPNLTLNDYLDKILSQVEKELMGPYTSYSLDKFKKLLQREYKTYSLILAATNRRINQQMSSLQNARNQDSNRNKKGHLISLLRKQVGNAADEQEEDGEDDDSKTPTSPSTTTTTAEQDVAKLTELHSELKRLLEADRTQIVARNDQIVSIIQSSTEKAEKNSDQTASSSSSSPQKSKDVKIEIDEYIKAANEVLTARHQSYNLMKKHFKHLFNLDKQANEANSNNEQALPTNKLLERGRSLLEEVDAVLSRNKKLIVSGQQLLDYKYECIAYNENLVKLKKEFHGKNKRFKKEIKDRIATIKDIDISDGEKESNYISISAKISSIIRFSKHNMKGGTMSILRTMLDNIRNMQPPGENIDDENTDFNEGGDSPSNSVYNSLNCAELYECGVIQENVGLELVKQVDLCQKLLSKLQDYALKKQRKLQAKMKQIGLLPDDSRSKADDDSPEFDEDEYHADDIVVRINESGEYQKKFLMVIWKTKTYRVYESEIAYQNGKDPIIEHAFRPMDYSYNGHIVVEVRRSGKSNKTSTYKGYGFSIARHVFVVKDMLDIKYWRNYIQRGENMRKASQDWEAHLSTPNRSGLVHPSLNNDDSGPMDVRDRRSRYIRKTRSSSLI